jgi:hypothetical protein
VAHNKSVGASRQKANISEFYRVFDLTGRVEISYFRVLKFVAGHFGFSAMVPDSGGYEGQRTGRNLPFPDLIPGTLN